MGRPNQEGAFQPDNLFSLGRLVVEEGEEEGREVMCNSEQGGEEKSYDAYAGEKKEGEKTAEKGAMRWRVFKVLRINSVFWWISDAQFWT